MGLDMYLTASEYVRAGEYRFSEDGNSEYVPNPTYYKILDDIEFENYHKSDMAGGIQVEVPMGYWRKANAIHGWFVRECGNNVDECQRIYVSTDKLRELLDLCKQVQADHSLAPELLPVTQGFFFGSYEYDDWYFEDIDQTIAICENALYGEERYFYYQASW